ncbi:MAG: hypothetical protein A2Z47_03280 [Thermodesulfovibrio sp. RBG_19FT_COMBO_42_12]|nr:MAG: hypothetical protein A2Z47_03280 [Thermodesulfovibrio sp. RBG_19FT_COMBO_42_12]
MANLIKTFLYFEVEHLELFIEPACSKLLLSKYDIIKGLIIIWTTSTVIPLLDRGIQKALDARLRTSGMTDYR